jgi:hypothetical protein
MSKARRPAATPPGKPASEKTPASQETPAPAEDPAPPKSPASPKTPVSRNKAAPAKAARRVKAATSTSKARPNPVPTPYDPEYERPLSELPPLIFPHSEEYEFRLAADRQRRSRIRNEALFGAVLVVVGIVILIAAHTPGFLALAAIAGVAMAAYELTISGLE